MATDPSWLSTSVHAGYAFEVWILSLCFRHQHMTERRPPMTHASLIYQVLCKMWRWADSINMMDLSEDHWEDEPENETIVVISYIISVRFSSLLSATFVGTQVSPFKDWVIKLIWSMNQIFGFWKFIFWKVRILQNKSWFLHSLGFHSSKWCQNAQGGHLVWQLCFAASVYLDFELTSTVQPSRDRLRLFVIVFSLSE